ncbi:hypothetical protein C0Q70_19784 [Pomacea canaliculata]|uniref:DUF885 domain-containing protein n=1 Tax=Pomacea canaliculata TaxID=400727 RepID=A0A2T7NDQ4_POMCA|nr:hypothetical protein C0Q70_19784 [Pomacea canaliculata]
MEVEKYELPGIRLVWFNFHVPTYSDHEGFKAGHACCTRTPIHAPEALRSLEADFWAWRMEDAPEFATAAGETCHNDLLESFDISVYQTRKVKVLEYLNRLQGVNREQLSPTDKLDYDIFDNHLQTFLDGARFDMYVSVNPVNFLEGVNANPGHLQVIMPFTDICDYEDYLLRLELLPQQIDEKIELMQTAITLGHTLNKMSVIRIPSQIDDIVMDDAEESPFYAPAFTTKLDNSDVPSSKRTVLRARAENCINLINQALLRMKDFLELAYIPAARTTWGVAGWPDGKQLYQQCLKYHTSTDMTPQEVYDLGLKEVSRIRGNMEAALKRLNFQGSIKQFYDSIRADPKFYKNSPEELLSTFEDYIYNHIFPKLPKLFKNIPDFPLKVEQMPYDGPGGVYMAGTPDKKVPGIFYANVTDPSRVSTLNLMALTLHETLPGHHLQAIYSLSANMPPFRALIEDNHYYRMPATFPIHTAYIEGWGLYSEYLGEELGLYQDDYMLMGRYSEEIFRACRLVVDTGLHYFGWERERAIQYLLDNSVETPENVKIEVDRYLTWPGQATAYKVGEIKIKQLRQKASNALGDLFDIRDFHSVILVNGGMPLNLLEQLVDDWIAATLHPENALQDKDEKICTEE